MTLRHFQTIFQSIEHRNLLSNANYIAERKRYRLYILLFQMGNKYIELVLDSTGTSVIATNTFYGTKELDPYLAAIELPDFFQEL